MLGFDQYLKSYIQKLNTTSKGPVSVCIVFISQHKITIREVTCDLDMGHKKAMYWECSHVPNLFTFSIKFSKPNFPYGHVIYGLLMARLKFECYNLRGT